jgi:rubrerythrin
MVICVNCKKKVSFWSSHVEENEYFCNDCWKDGAPEKLKIEAEKRKKEEQKRLEKENNQVTEYKRKCNQCGKVWHSLVGTERRLNRRTILDSLVSVGTALTGNLGASTQSSRNADAQIERIENVRKCPNCGSSDYKEEIITFQKKL